MRFIKSLKLRKGLEIVRENSSRIQKKSLSNASFVGNNFDTNGAKLNTNVGVTCRAKEKKIGISIVSNQNFDFMK